MELHKIDKATNLTDEQYFRLHGTLTEERLNRLFDWAVQYKEDESNESVIDDLKHDLEMSLSRLYSDIEDSPIKEDIKFLIDDLCKSEHTSEFMKKQLGLIEKYLDEFTSKIYDQIDDIERDLC